MTQPQLSTSLSRARAAAIGGTEIAEGSALLKLTVSSVVAASQLADARWDWEDVSARPVGDEPANARSLLILAVGAVLAASELRDQRLLDAAMASAFPPGERDAGVLLLVRYLLDAVGDNTESPWWAWYEMILAQRLGQPLGLDRLRAAVAAERPAQGKRSRGRPRDIALRVAARLKLGLEDTHAGALEDEIRRLESAERKFRGEK